MSPQSGLGGARLMPSAEIWRELIPKQEMQIADVNKFHNHASLERHLKNCCSVVRQG